MSKQSLKKVIEINHALSGIYGDEMKSTAFRITETRKDILKRLERKKKLASIIHDELYAYLEKYPEEKLGLHQEQFKKKKARLAEFEERTVYHSPALTISQPCLLTQPVSKLMSELAVWKYPLPQPHDEDSTIE